MAYNVDVLCYGILCVIALWIKTQALPGKTSIYIYRAQGENRLKFTYFNEG